MNTMLQILDGVGQRFVQLNDRFRLGIAQTPAECEAVFRLRYQTVIERGWATPDQYPDGLERDDDDERALQLVVWDGDTLAGTGRMVLPSPDYLLPTEAAFDLVIEPRLKVIDVGRAAIDSAYRGIQQQIFLGILGQCWATTREQGFQDMCGAMVPGMVRLYRFIGFEWNQLAPSRHYWGEERAPYQLDLQRSAESLQSRSELFWKKLATPPP